MSERFVSIRLTAAIGNYKTAMAQAAQATRQLKRDVATMARDSKAEMQTVGIAMAAVGGAAVAGFGIAVKSMADFDRQMSAVAAVANATAGEMEQLREAAIKAGADTAFSASEAAMAMEELVKAGISIDDVLGGALAGALDLAAAGGLQLADAATLAAQAMNVFEMAGSDVGHIADVLAAGANKSAADVNQLGEALRQGALVAAQTGLSFEETSAALSMFADNALVGSDAGTSLKTMLQRLTPQSDEAAELMAQLGFNAYDTSGAFIGLEGLARELQEALSGMTAEQRNATLATLFGSDAVRGASVLYSRGADAVREYVEAVDDQGAAAEMAATKLDNLHGDLDELSGSIETALIQSGSHANGILRNLAQTSTDLVNVYNDLPAPLQATATGLVGVGGGLTLAGGAALIAIPKIVEFRAALAKLGAPSITAALGRVAGFLMGPWGAALAIGTVALGAWIDEQADARRRTEEFKDTLDETTGALTELSRTAAVKDWADMRDRAEEVGVSLSDLVDASLGSASANRRVRETLDEVIQASLDYRDANGVGNQELADASAEALLLKLHLDELTETYRRGLKEKREDAIETAEGKGEILDLQHAIARGLDPTLGALVIRQQDAADAADEHAGSQFELGAAADEATNALERQHQLLAGTVDPVLGAARAMAGYSEALAELTEMQDEGTASAEELAEQKRVVAERALDVRGALADLRDEEGNLITTTEEVRAALAEMGLPPAVVDQLMRDLGLVLRELERVEAVDPTVTMRSIGGDSLLEQLKELSRWVDAVSGSSVTIRMAADNRVGSVVGAGAPRAPRGIGSIEGAAAKGGPVHPGLWLVGEEGPELVDMRGHGQVIPKSALGDGYRLAAGGPAAPFRRNVA